MNYWFKVIAIILFFFNKKNFRRSLKVKMKRKVKNYSPLTGVYGTMTFKITNKSLGQ